MKIQIGFWYFEIVTIFMVKTFSKVFRILITNNYHHHNTRYYELLLYFQILLIVFVFDHGINYCLITKMYSSMKYDLLFYNRQYKLHFCLALLF